MKIVPVTTAADLKRFVRLPYRLYKDDKIWVPPLFSEVLKQFDRRKNPTLEHCDYALFLLVNENEIIGRIAAFTDSVALESWKQPIGLFGYFECINNQEASKALFDSASDWLREKGMKYIRGPWSFVSEEWGLVVEGFEPSPTVMAPYNPAYYEDHLTNYTFQKIKDLLVYYISVKEGYTIPDRILTLTNDVVNRYNIRTRQLNMHDYDNEVGRIIELSNRSLIDNWGYTEVTIAEAESMAKDLKSIIHPKGVIFAEDRMKKPIGFAIAIPDINTIIKDLNGSLLPFGWIKLLHRLPRLNNYRLFGLGVIPEYHGKGIDSLLYRALYESLYTPETWLEINYVLEDNAPMNNAIKKLNAKPLRRYRIYQKSL
jgi:GNAT superfamily N-acetyltransferase